jgi:hypothetical protein
MWTEAGQAPRGRRGRPALLSSRQRSCRRPGITVVGQVWLQEHPLDIVDDAPHQRLLLVILGAVEPPAHEGDLAAQVVRAVAFGLDNPVIEGTPLVAQFLIKVWLLQLVHIIHGPEEAVALVPGFLEARHGRCRSGCARQPLGHGRAVVLVPYEKSSRCHEHTPR